MAQGNRKRMRRSPETKLLLRRARRAIAEGQAVVKDFVAIAQSLRTGPVRPEADRFSRLANAWDSKEEV